VSADMLNTQMLMLRITSVLSTLLYGVVGARQSTLKSYPFMGE